MILLRLSSTIPPIIWTFFGTGIARKVQMMGGTVVSDFFFTSTYCAIVSRPLSLLSLEIILGWISYLNTHNSYLNVKRHITLYVSLLFFVTYYNVTLTSHRIILYFQFRVFFWSHVSHLVYITPFSTMLKIISCLRKANLSACSFPC